MTIEWAQPLWLLALGAIPLLFLWQWRGSATITLPRAGLLKREGMIGPRWAAPAPLVLRALTLALLVVALAPSALCPGAQGGLHAATYCGSVAPSG